MNIQDAPLYSKATVGLRQPTRFKEQDFRLVLVYPMLFCDGLPIIQELELILRDFLSTTFLKEVFVQNVINITSLAARVRPVYDESGSQVLPVVSTPGQSSEPYSSYVMYQKPSISYPIDPVYKSELQDIIKRKTAIIRKYTQIDPVLQKLRPYIEMITMGNLIEVPVIVGTKAFRLNPLTLFHFLIASVSMRVSLNNMNNINKVVTELKNLDMKSYAILISNLTLPPGPSNIEKLKQKSTRSEVSTNVSQKITSFPNLSSRYTGTNKSIPKVGNVIPDPLFFILNYVKSDLDNLVDIFRLCLDQAMLFKHTGINPTTQESIRSSLITSTPVLKQINSIEVHTLSNFGRFMSTQGTRLLTSAGVSVPVIHSASFDLVSHVESCISSIISEVNSVFEDNIKQTISSFLQDTSYDQMQSLMDRLKEFCKINFKLEKYNQIRDLFYGYSSKDLYDFLENLENLSSSSVGDSAVIEKNLISIIGNKIQSDLVNIKGKIAKNLNNFFMTFNLLTWEPGQIQSEHLKYYVSYLTNCFYFYFLISLRIGLCETSFVEAVDVEFEKSSTEVTDFPNYSFVIPLEFILAIHSAIMAKGWKSLTTLMKESNNNETPMWPLPSETNIKQIIKVVCASLDIPNLFVVDFNKNEIYYKMMHHSDINKVKIETIKTFIKSALTKEITD